MEKSNQIKSNQILKGVASKKYFNEYNINESRCKISRQRLAKGEGVLIKVANNNSAYISKEYINKFKGKISKDFINKMYQIVLSGNATLITNTKDIVQCDISTNLRGFTNGAFKIEFKNGCILHLYNTFNEKTNKFTSSNLKAHLTRLANLKSHIKSISFYDSIICKNVDITDKSINQNYIPTYILNQYNYYNYHLGYNADSKKTFIKEW